MQPHKYLVLFFFSLASIISLFGCSDKKESKILNEANIVIEEHPDSALLLINSIDTTMLTSVKLRAKYALLKTQAEIKNNYIITSDSLIKRAYDYYYSKGSDNIQLMKAAFYYSVVCEYSNRLTEAIQFASLSYDIAHKLKDYYWIAKISEEISFIFANSYNAIESRKYTLEACVNYKKANKLINHYYSICDLCVSDDNNGNKIEALYRIDSLINILKNRDENMLMAYCLRIKFPICVDLNMDKEAEKTLYNLINNFHEYHIPPRYYAIYAGLKIKNHELKRAKSILDSISNLSNSARDKIAIYVAYRDLYKLKDDFKNAFQFQDSIQMLQNKEVDKLITQDVALAQKNYYDIRAQNKQKEISKSNAKIIGLSLIFVILIILIIAINRRKIQKKNEKICKDAEDIGILSGVIKDKIFENDELQISIRNQNSDIIKLENSLISKNADIENLYFELTSLFREQWTTLNALCFEYFDSGNSERERLRIAKNMENHLDLLRNKSGLKSIENSVNKYMDNIVVLLREQCPFFREEDYIFIFLNYAGFSPRAVCLFTNIKLKYYYTRKERIINRIRKSGCHDMNKFISFLESSRAK